MGAGKAICRRKKELDRKEDCCAKSQSCKDHQDNAKELLQGNHPFQIRMNRRDSFPYVQYNALFKKWI